MALRTKVSVSLLCRKNSNTETRKSTILNIVTMNPPQEYSVQELADDVRKLINHLQKHGILGLQPGIDFDAITVITEEGEVDVDLFEDEMEVEVPPHIVRMVRWYSGR